MRRAIQTLCIELVGKTYRAILVSPASTVTLPGDNRANWTWLTIRVGDTILLHDVPEVIQSVFLYDVQPSSECDKRVSSGADWLDGADDASTRLLADS